jgi:hypothetical protein
VTMACPSQQSRLSWRRSLAHGASGRLCRRGRVRSATCSMPVRGCASVMSCNVIETVALCDEPY